MSGPLILLREDILEDPEMVSEQIVSLQPAEGSELIAAMLPHVRASSLFDVGASFAPLGSGQVPQPAKAGPKQPGLSKA